MTGIVSFENIQDMHSVAENFSSSLSSPDNADIAKDFPGTVHWYTGDVESEVLLVEDPRFLETFKMYQMRITFLVKPQSMVFEPGDDGDEIQFVDANEYENSELWTERQIFMFSSLAKKRLASL